LQLKKHEKFLEIHDSGAQEQGHEHLLHDHLVVDQLYSRSALVLTTCRASMPVILDADRDKKSNFGNFFVKVSINMPAALFYDVFGGQKYLIFKDENSFYVKNSTF
jgi:hypothetical protein